MADAIASCMWRALPVKWNGDDVLHGSTASEETTIIFWLSPGSQCDYGQVWVRQIFISWVSKSPSFASAFTSFYSPAKWHRWCSAIHRSCFFRLWWNALSNFSGDFGRSGEADITTVFNNLGSLKAEGRLYDLAIVTEQVDLWINARPSSDL